MKEKCFLLSAVLNLVLLMCSAGGSDNVNQIQDGQLQFLHAIGVYLECAKTRNFEEMFKYAPECIQEYYQRVKSGGKLSQDEKRQMAGFPLKKKSELQASELSFGVEYWYLDSVKLVSNQRYEIVIKSLNSDPNSGVSSAFYADAVIEHGKCVFLGW